MSPVAVVVVAVAALVLIVLIGAVVSYNRFITQRNLVTESWSQIDVELQRRHDLIPNLVRTVQGYAAHEHGVFEQVTQARTLAEQMRAQAGDDRKRRADAENALTRAVGALVGVAENYPQLKASQNFLALQQELVETEDRIAAGRRFYNGNVRALNTRVESVPSALIANMFHFKQAAYFPLDDPAARDAVRVDLDGAQP